MSKLYPLWFAVLALALGLLAMIIKQHAMCDSIANLSLPYLCSIIAFALLMVGIHCLLFGSPPQDLRLLPNLIMFLLVSWAVIIDVIWDGLANGFPIGTILLNVEGNSLEFVMFYAAFLFLPRLRREKAA